MFSAAISSRLVLSDGENTEQTDQSREVERIGSVALNQDVRLPLDNNLPTGAEYQASVGCGPQELGYTLSGGSPRPGAQVTASVSTGLSDSIQLLSSSAPPAQLVVRLSITSLGAGDLQSRTGSFQFTYNGQTHTAQPGQGPLSRTLKTNVANPNAVPLEFGFTDSVSFSPNQTGNLTRRVEISSVSFQDSQGNPIQFRYTTQSGQKYNVPTGSGYGLGLAAGASPTS